MLTTLKSGLALVALSFSAVALAGSGSSMMVNNAEEYIRAPVERVWQAIPGVRTAGVEVEHLEGTRQQAGWKFHSISKDAQGKVVKKDLFEILVWEPNKRMVARVHYLPPQEPLEIVLNIELKDLGQVTHFRLDSYSFFEVPDAANLSAEQLLQAKLKVEQEAQAYVIKGYESFRQRLEAETTK